MQALSPGFLAVLGAQIGSLSAFLGGFAATVLVMLLTSPVKGRAATWAASLAAVAAFAFIVAAIATTTLVAGAHPDAPAGIARAASDGIGRLVASLCFALGGYALLAALGASGWLKSRTLGRLTSVGGGLAALALTAVLAGF